MAEEVAMRELSDADLAYLAGLVEKDHTELLQMIASELNRRAILKKMAQVQSVINALNDELLHHQEEFDYLKLKLDGNGNGGK